MPCKPPPAPAKGTRHPGAGRKKGTPNKVSVEAKVLVAELVNNPNYQYRLRKDFARRKLHPTIESLVWAYFLGKPRQPVEVSGALEVNTRLAEERQAFALLDVEVLEQLAAESQALVDRALSLAAERVKTLAPPPDIVVDALPDKGNGESLRKSSGSDNGGYAGYGSGAQPDASPGTIDPITPASADSSQDPPSSEV